MPVDLVYLARSIRRSPASATAAVLTLALTLGTAASIGAVVRAVLFVPPPFSDPDSLVLVGEKAADDPTEPARPVSYATFEAWRERAARIATLEAMDGTNLTLTGIGMPERVSVTDITAGFFSLLGVTPVRGRVFASADAGQPVVVIGHGFWRGTLGGDEHVVGRQIILGGRSHTIVGVLPETFSFELNLCDIWRPLPAPAEALRTRYPVTAVARLPRNVTSSMLTAALDDVSRTSSPPARAVATPIVEAIAGDATRTIGLLATAAALATLIAFTNFAGLLIVRTIDRRREIAIRSALGARRSNITIQLLAEAQVFVVIGTVAGVLLAAWLTPPVARVALEQFAGVAHRHVTLSWQVIATVALAASACAAISALIPSVLIARSNPADALRRGATAPPHELRVRRAFVIAEVAIAFVLLASLTLVARSFIRLLTTSPGFDAHGVLALQVSVPAATYDTQRTVAFYRTLQQALDDRFGPRTGSLVNEIPLTGDRGRTFVATGPTASPLSAVVREVGNAYFDVMRVPITAGRSFAAPDAAAVQPRIVISRSLAERLFASGDAVGRRIWLSSQTQWADIIGVVSDVKHRALDEQSLPTIYRYTLQVPSRSNIIIVRSSYPDADVVATAREEIARLDGSIPVYRVRTMRDVVDSSPGMPERRVLTAAFLGFALLALALSGIGLFGVVAHDVASRRVELALRIALGADPARIFIGTISRGASVVTYGAAVGALMSVWAARMLDRVGVPSTRADVMSLGVPLVMLIAASAAAVLPVARQAAATDPLLTLRSE
jgi:predicted permease